MDRKFKGKYGEDLAATYLERQGIEIIERNYRFQKSEIDLIGIHNNNLLIFIEVKLRTNNYFGEPEDFVSNNQQNLIIEAAEDYIKAINWQGDIRFDIIAIDTSNNEIRQFKDAFY